MRKTLFKIHSWVALIALIPLLVISITGSVLVFKSEIDGLLMPDSHFVVQQQANRLPIDTLITKTQKTYLKSSALAAEVQGKHGKMYPPPLPEL